MKNENRKKVKKYMKSIPMIQVFLSVCFGKRKEKDIVKDVGYQQPTVRQYLNQLIELDFIKKERGSQIIEKNGQKNLKRCFLYSPVYSTVVNKILRIDLESNQESVEFFIEKFERFLKIICIQMFLLKNLKLKKITLEDLERLFVDYLLYHWKNLKENERKYVSEYVTLSDSMPLYLDESLESYDEFEKFFNK